MLCFVRARGNQLGDWNRVTLKTTCETRFPWSVQKVALLLKLLPADQHWHSVICGGLNEIVFAGLSAIKLLPLPQPLTWSQALCFCFLMRLKVLLRSTHESVSTCRHHSTFKKAFCPFIQAVTFYSMFLNANISLPFSLSCVVLF